MINYIFDTDHLSLIQRNNQEGKNILKKLMAVENPRIAVTIITYEEQVRGRLLFIAKAKNTEQQLLGYQGLQNLLINYQSIIVIPFKYEAIIEYQKLRKKYPRLGSMDLKIASITITNNAILLTRNNQDFTKITELKIEDWSF
ncbi:type II toxin-antitoxin system VapC family toxin [Geminocystis sp. CENA526]|uniref:type II toxin-antitoxin system VapC family toxin n=1 Tax=Geminocystis sp. CENA526 TaxID=1355871 RepID=UPI003D6E94F5